MDYSAANTGLWNIVVQLGIIASSILVGNLLRRKVSLIRDSLLPTSALAGFILLILRSIGALKMDAAMLEMTTYHGIALGFIAMSLRVNNKTEGNKGYLVGAKSGAIIVGSYLIQAVFGLIISLGLAYTVMPGLFKAAGILLPMGYGQGPGQANNVGGTYEALGFVGGRSFGLSIAASGYLCACIVGIIALNILIRRGKLKKVAHEDLSGSATVDTFQDEGEIPISESIDKFSIQAALVIIVYLFTYLATKGLTDLFSFLSPALADTINSLLWGFNFIIGSVLAILTRILLQKLRRSKVMTRQYQNNYLLSRISGLAFDLMIVAGIASIELRELTGLWVPFILMSIAGGAVTWFYLVWVCKHVYKGYFYEGLMSMYGMMTGTISSGILLLREIDPNYETPAANNLVVGSSFAIVFGAPMLIFIGLAPKSDLMCFVTLGLCFIYFLILMMFIFNVNRRKK
ncbi:MAG TPA: sodium:glutamate symporter [Clostridiales bacterium]|nr:sodium:glutamate symporter [Clostridiales bacterium]